jgi:hypothetical protein
MVGIPQARESAQPTDPRYIFAANFLTESACALDEMFLIKRPFFQRQSITRALKRYG